ncbi:hypothetical protein RUM43_007930 [Polyplax serrata]|uniref:5-formyltetrahydrofolate cyclo-ligase n=1 Tax=Polyplax serrata TaxID=468196 RepID=A0AAN8PNE5_POLSC
MSDGENMTTAKSLLRKKLYAALKSLPTSEVTRQSDIVTNKVLNTVQFDRAKVVSIYLSMDKEIQTETLVEEILKRGKECFIPR